MLFSGGSKWQPPRVNIGNSTQNWVTASSVHAAVVQQSASSGVLGLASGEAGQYSRRVGVHQIVRVAAPFHCCLHVKSKEQALDDGVRLLLFCGLNAGSSDTLVGEKQLVENGQSVVNELEVNEHVLAKMSGCSRSMFE